MQHDDSPARPHGPHSREHFAAVYQESDRVWSGNPNAALVSFVSDAPAPPAGTALDIGCGEGADVVYLASRGWHVVGIDLVDVAIERSQQLLAEQVPDVAARVQLEAIDFRDFSARGETFDLVSCHYSTLPAEAETLHALEDAVAPGGYLLFVHHYAEGEGVAMPAWVRDRLSALEVLSFESRPRNVSHGAGAHHHEDVVLIAQRPAEESF
ncbi:class I SAM-dependent methyltransferase [Corynebacterium sp. 32222D000AT]|uniref:class I SAM-dependent methyltransferase n=1 Tax=unclassified Corynebacterium TaxID=2624378 RepID=UPI002A9F391F|nr:class I SAM-dependent methyltransferase [Mycobacteriaceae bacterium]MDY5830141.1 class I SAM-dependent methyltransferase [Corynebacterium sp.]